MNGNVLRFCLQEWCETQYLDTTASSGYVVPATHERCMWRNDGMTTGKMDVFGKLPNPVPIIVTHPTW